MPDATAEFLDRLAKREHDALLKKATGTLRIDLKDGTRTSRWLVSVRKGDVTVSRQNRGADCVVRADKAIFDRIVVGELNAMAATLRGVMTIDGDPELFVLFQRLFPGPVSSQDRRHAAGYAERRS